ncbi:mitochondrial ribosomal protein L3 [Arctopsyche grandis]|uniref:mitochondrial ribosomal protein L3 n=1 Tax=Arctopsyche grandis TaxID=121162 RepID=UPI00406D63BC
MALARVTGSLCKQFLNLSLNQKPALTLVKNYIRPRQRYPELHIRSHRVIHEDFITPENKTFLNEVIQDRMQKISSENAVNKYQSPLTGNTTKPFVWSQRVRRTGLIAKKIGVYPLWTNNGYRVQTTLLQIVDNQVIKYIPPEEWKPLHYKIKERKRGRFGCLLVGAETVDPSLVTKEYYGLFKNTGVLPKRRICRFTVSPQAALPPGTPLVASHFRVGDVVDCRGLTIDRGFQGVMKRWGFKGMPASHGVTKTHRRPGNIGGGGEKARVWPGTKLPGHMGNRWRVNRGLKVLRINTKLNVLWVTGDGIPGPTNSYIYVFDTVLPLHRHKTAPPFPTYYPTGDEEEDIYASHIHNFSDPTIMFEET